MRHILYPLLLITIFSACQNTGNNQTNTTTSKKSIIPLKELPDIEHNIATYLRSIDHWRDDTASYKDDSLHAANEDLKAYIQKVGVDEPSTISAPFASLDSLGMKVISSDDRMFRIYCWDSWEGGTMHIFNSFAQYETNGKTAIHPLDIDTIHDGGDPGYWYTDMITITAGNGANYYLALYRGVYSTKDVSIGIRAFTIEGDKLNDTVKLFKATSRSLNSIDCSYDYFSNYDDKTAGQRNIIHLSPDKKTLYIPVVKEDKVTAATLVYKFNGSQFVYDKNAR